MTVIEGKTRCKVIFQTMVFPETKITASISGKGKWFSVTSGNLREHVSIPEQWSIELSERLEHGQVEKIFEDIPKIDAVGLIYDGYVVSIDVKFPSGERLLTGGAGYEVEHAENCFEFLVFMMKMAASICTNPEVIDLVRELRRQLGESVGLLKL